MRPTLRFLTDESIRRIVAEAVDVLCQLGVAVHHAEVLSILADHGAEVDRDGRRARLTVPLIEQAIQSAPRSVPLFDVLGSQTHELGGDAVHFTPGSTALHLLDSATQKIRTPNTRDYLDYAKVVSQLPHFAAQSTAMIPDDVPAAISDSYRLLLSLLYCEKPVVTGAFSIAAVAIMLDLQRIVRGTDQALRERPLTIFSCCPNSPLGWSEVSSQNLVDCARHGIPVEVVPMPLAGFLAPVTLAGTLVQHAAEALSGVVISQLIRPGTPVLYGGSSAIFDFRHETTPMGAIETMMIACGANEIGKHLGLPTQSYIALSDAKRLDAQAGLESGMGATLAALSGINSVSGPGMLEFENCLSLEKLIVDHESCGMALRLVQGIGVDEDLPEREIFEELLRDGHLLIADHTRQNWKAQLAFPGSVIDRSRRDRWEQAGSPSLLARARQQIERLLESYRPSRLPEAIQRELVQRMQGEARRYGLKRLPARE